MFLGSGLLGQVPPNLLALEPWIAYLSVHIFISSILYFVPVEINHPLMDVCLFWLDAATKSGAIFGAIAGCSNHPNTLVQQSTFAPIVLSALAPVGGGTVAHMFCVHEQNWGFTSPPWLKPGNGILSTLDMWTAAVAAIMYGILTQSHPSYEPWREFLGLPSKGAFTVLGARSAVVSFLMVAYGLRAVYLYVPKASSRIKKNDNKEKGSSIKKRSEKIQ